MVAVPVALLALIAVAISIWNWRTIKLYFSDTAELTIDDFNPEFEEFQLVQVNGAGSVTVSKETKATVGERTVGLTIGDGVFKPREPIVLSPGKYLVSTVGRGGEKVTRWKVAGSGFFSGFTTQHEGEKCPVEVKRGERIQVSVAKWNQAAQGSSLADMLSDKDRLQGTWVGVTGWNGGQRIRDEQIKQVRVVFAGGRMRVEQLGRPPDEGAFHLEPSASPKVLDVIGTDQRGRFGIYRFEGDQLHICMGEDNARPQRFQTDPQFPTRLFIVLRREAAGGQDKAVGAVCHPCQGCQQPAQFPHTERGGDGGPVGGYHRSPRQRAVHQPTARDRWQTARNPGRGGILSRPAAR
jgi:uncharacterized protein (TIGR03067 family)